MSRAVGIDLGTTNSVVVRSRGRRAGRRSERRGFPDDPVGRRVLQERRDPGRRGRQAPGDHEPRPDRPLRQASHGRQGLGPGRGRQALDAAGDLGPDPRQAEARRRGVSGRHRHPGGRHRPRVLRRLAAHRPPRRPGRSRGSRCCASSTSRQRPRSPTGWTSSTTRRSSCSTSAGARSTCRCSRSAKASSRSSPLTATRSSAVTTGTSASSTGWSRSSRTTTASTSATTGWRSSD